MGVYWGVMGPPEMGGRGSLGTMAAIAYIKLF